MDFNTFLTQQRLLAQAIENNPMPFWKPLYKRFLEILETANQDDMYETIQALYTEQHAATDPHVKSFWRRKENELRQAIGR